MRKPRKLMDNATYHVTARANRSEFILNGAEEKEEFLSVLKRAKKRFGFTLKSFCIMGNHIHLMIKPPKAYGLSKIMQWILSVYALSFNRKFGYTGHVWYDRFHSTIIQTAAYFIKVFQYISDNPVKAEICPNPINYPYAASYFILRARFGFIEPPDNLLKIYFPELILKQLPLLH
jgi:REP element-mobilizing transposase RayT